MKSPVRLSALILIGMLMAGSSALGYYYYYVYHPPLEAAESFLNAIAEGDSPALQEMVLVSDGDGSEELRPPSPLEISLWLSQPFEPGRVLDQRRRDGEKQSYHYLVYREPDGQVYALMATEIQGQYRIVVPPRGVAGRRWYLWDYTWTN